MYWNKNARARGGGQWRCRERRKAHDRKQRAAYYYERMPFEVHVRQRLYQRRYHALRRRRERQLRREHGPLQGEG